MSVSLEFRGLMWRAPSLRPAQVTLHAAAAATCAAHVENMGICWERAQMVRAGAISRLMPKLILPYLAVLAECPEWRSHTCAHAAMQMYGPCSATACTYLAQPGKVAMADRRQLWSRSPVSGAVSAPETAGPS